MGDFLRAFEEATRSFLADRYPTFHLFLDIVLCPSSFKKSTMEIKSYHKRFSKTMNIKIGQVWNGKYNMALVICSVLDLRKKLDYLGLFYNKLSQKFIDMERNIDLAKD